VDVFAKTFSSAKLKLANFPVAVASDPPQEEKVVGSIPAVCNVKHCSAVG
jgi:hypothetical protein